MTSGQHFEPSVVAKRVIDCDAIVLAFCLFFELVMIAIGVQADFKRVTREQVFPETAKLVSFVQYLCVIPIFQRNAEVHLGQTFRCAAVKA